MELISQILIFKVYIIGFGISFLAQSITQAKFGKESAWGLNKGWQTEIAIWNIFAIIILSAFIFRNFESNLVVLGLFFMSLGFAINHLIAAKAGGANKSNLIGVAANGVGIVLILVWYFLSGH